MMILRLEFLFLLMPLTILESVYPHFYFFFPAFKGPVVNTTGFDFFSFQIQLFV